MAILDLIFPKNCLECKTPGKYICSNCLKKVKKNGWNSDWVYSVWKYQGVIRKAILVLKYRYSTDIARELATHISRVLKKENIDLEKACLVPVPLHWYRKNVRGFNQSEEIGKVIAKKMNWKFVPDLLIRTKSTTPQAQLTGSARRENLHGAFSLNSNILISQCLNIVLFDDVLTTGSTLLEASKILREGGIKRVLCLTIAK
jgi:ComF family protein